MINLSSGRAASMLEMTLVLPVILMLTLAGIDFLRYGFLLSAAQFTVEQSANWASHGDTIVGKPNNRSLLKSRVVEIGSKSGIDIKQENITICAKKSEDCQHENDLQPGTLFTLKLVQPFRLLTLFGFQKNIYADASDKIPS